MSFSPIDVRIPVPHGSNTKKGCAMQRRRVRYGNAVLVDWTDSRAFAGWSYDPATPRLPAQIKSLGYVVQSNAQGLVITTSLGSGGQSMDDLCVPWSAIFSLEILPGDYSRGGPSPDSLNG